VRGAATSELDIARVGKREHIALWAIQEHWCRDEEGMEVEGYEWVGCNRPTELRRGEGGVGFLVSEQLKGRVMVDGVGDDRLMWVRVRADPSERDLFVACFYGVCEGADVQAAEELLARLEAETAARRARGRVVICGDFNARIGEMMGRGGEATANSNGRRVVEMARRQALLPTLTLPFARGTWTRKASRVREGEVHHEESVIDYIFIEQGLRGQVERAEVGESDCISSDHHPLWCEIRWKRAGAPPRPPRYPRWRVEKIVKDPRQYQAAVQRALGGFEETVAGMEAMARCAGVDHQAVVEAVWSLFRERLDRALEEAVGKKMAGGRGKPWWSPELDALAREKGRCWSAFRDAQGGEEEDVVYSRYRRAYHTYKAAVRAAKRALKERQMEEIDEARRDANEPKRMWTLLGRLGGQRSRLPDVVQWGGREVTDTEEVIEAWAASFERLGVKLEKPHFDPLWREEAEARVARMARGGEGGGEGELDSPFSMKEVRWAMARLKNGKAKGLDDVRPEALKYGGECMARALGAVFNIVWKHECVPAVWKQGAIAPIFKAGDPTSLDNYRGITLLSVAGKVLEAIINCRVSGWAEGAGVLDDAQGGFRPGRGCEDLVFALREVLEARREEGKATFCAFVDVRKAYDSVWIDGLMTKLWDLGVRGRVWRLLREWNSGVSSCVKVSGRESRAFPLHQGVKQGSLLSPFLYCVFVNDLARLYRAEGLGVGVEGVWAGVMQYADDIVLAAASAKELARMLAIFEEFATKWRFEINAKKSEVMVVGAAVRGSQWVVDGRSLVVVNTFKYLGVTFARSGTWTHGARRLAEKGRSRLRALVGLGMREVGFGVETAARLYQALVHPVLLYGAEVVGYVHTASEEMERVHRAAARRVLGCARSTPSDAALGELGWESVGAAHEEAKLRFFARLVLMPADRMVRQMWDVRKRKWDAWRQGVVGRPTETGGCRGWCPEAWQVLRKYGLLRWWREDQWGGFPSYTVWKGMVRRAVRGREERDWKERVGARPRTALTARLHPSPSFAEHLRGAEGPRRCHAARLLSKLRMETSGLRVCTGRYEQPLLPRPERICLACGSGQVEDEVHFLCECTAVDRERDWLWRAAEEAAGPAAWLVAMVKTRSIRGRMDWLLNEAHQVPQWGGKVGDAVMFGIQAMYRARNAVVHSSDEESDSV
jgi:exonuclease III